MQENSQFVVGLDIGNSSVKAIVGAISDGQVSIVGVGTAPTSGMRKGVVSDLPSLAESIDKALGEAEKTSGYEINSATISIDGASIISTKTDGMIAVTNQEISDDDVARLEELATVGKIPGNQTILTVVPHEYSLDGQSGVKDPVGMVGSRLEVKSSVISTLTPHIEGLKKVTHFAEVEPSQIIVSPVASARAVLNEKQRENGVMLLELGSSTTGIAIYEDGDLQYVAVLPVGANHLTNDLALGLQIDPEVAELVKLTHASAIFSDQSKKVSVKHSGQVYEFDQLQIDEIIRMRLQEIFKMVERKLRESGYLGKLPSGIVLSGGGAKLRGIDNFAKNYLGLVTNIAKCEYDFGGLSDKIKSTEFVTAVGLLMYDMKNPASSQARDQRGSGIFGGLKKLFKK